MLANTLTTEKRDAVKLLEPGEVGRLVAEDVVEDTLSLSAVESQAFRKLVNKIPVNNGNDKLS